ncbi:uncharacterized [Tachysurus ichikawai]
MRNEWLRTGSKTKTRDDHMLHVGVWNNKHALWKDKGGVSKSYLPCGDTGERRSCEELPEKRNKRRADEGRLLSFTGHASSRTSGAGLVEEPKQRRVVSRKKLLSQRSGSSTQCWSDDDDDRCTSACAPISRHAR